VSVPLSLRRKVVERAENRREYCRLAQAGQEALFHMDHVIPETAGGTTTFDNLALACVSCSLRKGAREFVVDPESGKNLRLFSPRRDICQEHFRWNGVRLVGTTAVGRGTRYQTRRSRTWSSSTKTVNLLSLERSTEDLYPHPT